MSDWSSDVCSSDLNSFSSEVDYIWRNCYKNINLTNTIIASAAQVAMNERQKARIVSEAKFIRALSYFWLVQLFGDVPLPLEPTAGVQREVNRVPADRVYEAILRSEERRVGKECVSTCRARWSPFH